MTVETLMKPRYKVIALWPFCRQHNNMSDQPKIGDIFLAGSDESISNHAITILSADKYTHLFRKLEWFEDREEKDMPEYVKTKAGTLSVKKVMRYVGCGIEFAGGNEGHSKFWIPATKEEYDQYKPLNS